MAFRDLDEVLGLAPPVVLPIGGREYAFPGDISARAWLVLTRLAESLRGGADDDVVVASDEEEAALRAELFGEGEAAMVADGCTAAEMKAVFYTLVAWHLGGKEAAEAVWESGGDEGKVPAPNRAQKRSRPRGSRAGSTSPRVAAAKRSPGRPSSSTGPRSKPT